MGIGDVEHGADILSLLFSFRAVDAARVQASAAIF